MSRKSCSHYAGRSNTFSVYVRPSDTPAAVSGTRFACFLSLLMRYRSEDEAQGHRFMGPDGTLLPALQEDTYHV